MNLDAEVYRMAKDLAGAGEVIARYQLSALSNFARRARLNGYWDKLLRVDFFCGRTAKAAGYSLKYVAGTSYPIATTPYTYADSKVHERLGALGDLAGGACYRTGMVPSVRFANSSSVMLAFGASVMGANAGYYAGFGCLGAGGSAPHCRCFMDVGANSVSAHLFDGSGMSTTVPAKRDGFYVFNRRTAATVNAWKDGAVLIGDTAINATGLPTTEMYYLGENTGAGSQNGTSVRYGSSMIGVGFLDADCVNLSIDHGVCMQELRRGM